MIQETELLNLIEQYLAGVMTEAEAAVLADQLDKSEELQAIFYRQFESDFLLRQAVEDDVAGEKAENSVLDESVFMNDEKLDSLVRLAYASPPLPKAEFDNRAEKTAYKPSSRSEKRARQTKTSHFPLFRTLLILLALFFSAAYFEFFGHKKETETTFIAFTPLAKISGMADVRWVPGAERHKSGQSLEAERLRFENGLLELTLSTGVRLVLTGPADIKLNAENKIYCGSGHLSASVPPHAVGFEVTTPFMSVVDLGTEFSLLVDEKKAETHVITGQIQLTHVPQGTETLGEGKGFQMSQEGIAKAIPADLSTFLTPQVVQRRIAVAQHREMERWIDSQRKYHDIPALLVDFDFSGNGTDVVNDSSEGRRRFGDGRFLAGQKVEGRFPERYALAFRASQDGVELDVPETFRSLTLFTSVRLDQIGRQMQVLLASRVLGDGSIFWQILPDGSLQLAVQQEERHGAMNYTSPPCLKPKHGGAWYTISMVLDADRKTVTHYLDGNPVSSQPIAEDLSVRIGAATLGNGFWKQMKNTNRTLCGSMERFMLFERALSEKELRDLSCLPDE